MTTLRKEKVRTLGLLITISISTSSQFLTSFYLPAKLVQDFNHLLSKLLLPLTIESPYDLTPSLLLAVLESVLRDRLPISAATRESKTIVAKVAAMKIFLGVLEGDILKEDIGLSEMDPRRLAAGELEEVLFVGNVLCSLGHNLPEDGTLEVSLSTYQADTSLGTRLTRYGESETTVTTTPPPFAPNNPTIPSSRPNSTCIHEIDITGLSLDHYIDGHQVQTSHLPPLDKPLSFSSLASATAPVRHGGCLRRISDDIDEFEASREPNGATYAGNKINATISPVG